jgi:hypothetical protein
MDQEMLVWGRRGLSRVKYAVKIAKRPILHEMDEYLYPTLQKLAVGKILRISRSDRGATHGQTTTTVTTTFSKNIDHWKSWRSDHPWWRSDHPWWRLDRPGTEAGGLTGPWWWSDRPGQTRPLKFNFPIKRLSNVFNNSTLYEPRRKIVVLTQNSHKNKELEQSGNYRWIK